MPFIAVYDANILCPSHLRDLLIRVAQAGLVQAKWTDQILDETFRSLKLVTENLKHFPQDNLDPWNVEANSADDFVLGLIDLSQQTVYAQVQRMADAWKNPPGSVDDVLNVLEQNGLVGSVAALRG